MTNQLVNSKNADASVSVPTSPSLTVTAKGVACAAVCVGLISWAPTFGAYIGIASALVAIHEAAHMVVARRHGLAVEEYAVGFGPKVFSVQTSKMAWSLRGLPFGGFVKIAGSSATAELPDGVDESATLRGCSSKARVATIAAGPISNFVVALILSTVAFGVVGHLGADGSRERLPLPDAASAAFNDVTATVTSTVSGLSAIITNPDDYGKAVVDGNRDEAPAAFLSPVGAADTIGSLGDVALVLRFAAIFSAGLGFFNLLPVPPLDGGHLMVELVERVRSRRAGHRVRINPRTLNVVAGVTLGFFFLLTVTALRFDLAV